MSHFSVLPLTALTITPSPRLYCRTGRVTNIEQCPTDKHFLGLWAWASTSVIALATRIFGVFGYDPYTQRSSPVGPTADIAASNCEIQEVKTSEKLYRFNDRGRVLKRSLREDEYYVLSDGERLVPPLVVERLKNEAACMEFIRAHTNIPIPKLLDAYEENGSYHLWIEFIDGVEMSTLTLVEQAELFPQNTSIELFRRSYWNPSPPCIVHADYLSQWKQQFSPDEKFVFCHSDLSQSNILVDRKTLRIAAIIDWEYGGFFPRDHELPFYKSPQHSGKQVNGKEFKSVVDKIIEFLATIASIEKLRIKFSFLLANMHSPLKLFFILYPDS
ncbi:hypothetical protein MMC17_009791 [Xylographa soralifera]|nr:hypothetical protein [Xylographa soralifera]